MLNGETVQRIHQHVDFEIEYYDTSNLNDKAGVKDSKASYHTNEVSSPGWGDETGKETEQIVKKFVRPFEVSRAPLLRVGLIKEKKNRHIFMMDIHHIVTDGISNTLLKKEVMALYAGEKLPPLKLQYKDFSGWQNCLLQSGSMKKREQYWLTRFKGDIPILNLPTDYQRPLVRASDQGALIVFLIDKALKNRLNDALKETGTTMYMFLLAVCTILLAKYSGQEDIVVGSPVSGRKHSDLERIIGILVNMMSIRNQPREHKTFREFLEEVKENAIAAYENQDYQFDELISKLGLQGHAERNPLFNVVFADINLDQPKVEIPGLTSKSYERAGNTTKFDLRIAAVEANGVINLTLTYSTTLFKKNTAEKMAKRFIEILEQVLENKDIKIKEISISYDLIDSKSKIVKDYQSAFEF
jgi:hypothetical protein